MSTSRTRGAGCLLFFEGDVVEAFVEASEEAFEGVGEFDVLSASCTRFARLVCTRSVLWLLRARLLLRSSRRALFFFGPLYQALCRSAGAGDVALARSRRRAAGSSLPAPRGGGHSRPPRLWFLGGWRTFPRRAARFPRRGWVGFASRPPHVAIFLGAIQRI